MRDPEEFEDELDNESSEEVSYNDDPAFDHLRDEERNFIQNEKERENDY